MNFRIILSAILVATTAVGCTRLANRKLSQSQAPSIKVLGIPQEPTRINEGSMAVLTNADSYSFKIDRAKRSDCTQSADYSIPYPKSQPIYYEGLASGNYIVCVRDIFPMGSTSSVKGTANLFVGTFTIDTDPPKMQELEVNVFDRVDLDIVVNDISQPVNLVWTQIAGEGRVSFVDQSGESISALIPLGTTSKNYTLQLEAMDTAGNTAKTMYRIQRTDKAQTKPSLSIVERIVTNHPTNIRSTSGGQGPMTYEWSMLKGELNIQPWDINWKASTLDIRKLQELADGRHTFALKITDALGHSNQRKVDVVFDRTKPFVDAGLDQFKLSSQKIFLSGNVRDENGIQSVQWRQVAGDAAARILNPHRLNTEVEIPADAIGKATFSLQAVDKAGNVNFDWVTVYLDNKKPFVEIAGEAQALTPDFHFQGLKAWDSSPFTIFWRQVSGPQNIMIKGARNITPTFRFEKDGEYLFEVSVTDAASNVENRKLKIDYLSEEKKEQESLSGSVSVDNGDENKTLVAEAKPPDIFGLNQSVRRGVRYIKPLVDIGEKNYRYKWYPISGPGKVTFSKIHSFETGLMASKKGHYQIGLEIFNGKGQVAKKSFSYFWDTDPPNLNYSVLLRGENLTLDPIVIDQTTVNLHSQWSQESGPTTINSEYLHADMAVLPNDLRMGGYQFRLKGCDQFDNCSVKKVSVVWPKTLHFKPEKIESSLQSRGKNNIEIASLPVIQGKRWSCELTDLATNKNQACTCNAGLCAAMINVNSIQSNDLDMLVSVCHFNYKISLDGEVLYESGFSMNGQSILNETNEAIRSRNSMLSH